MIFHFRKHTLYVGELQLLFARSLEGAQGMKLAARDLIGLDSVVARGEECAHVLHEGLGDFERQVERFAGHAPNITAKLANREHCQWPAPLTDHSLKDEEERKDKGGDTKEDAESDDTAHAQRLPRLVFAACGNVGRAPHRGQSLDQD